MSVEEIKTMKVQELKDELKLLGLSVTGVKAELAQRLEEAISGSREQAAPESNPAASAEAHASESAAKAASNGRAPIEFKPTNGSAPAEAKPIAEAAVAEKPAVAQPMAGLSEAEKARQRAERFGIVTVKDKLAARAKRFGTEEATTGASTGATAGGKAGITTLSEADKSRDIEKLKERAKRFALPEPLSKEEVDLKKKARLDRFGGVSESKKPDSEELAAKLAARAERFALSKGTEAEKPKEGGGKKAANPSSAVERKDAAQARAAALVKPAANPEQEAKRQARAIRFQAN